MMRVVLALLLALWLALPAVAQETEFTVPDDAEWPVVALRAEEALEGGDASIEALNDMRAELVEWRARFLERQRTNGPRIETLRTQIAALGPAPAEGETEPPAVAAQRSELNEQLEELMAPVNAARASFAEADGLIAETDELIEEERAEDLFRKDPAPLNPMTWTPAIASMGSWFASLGEELYAPFATPTARAVWQARWVELMILFFAAVVLLWRSGVWLGHLRDRVARHEGESAGARIGLLLISIVRMILPVLGLIVVTRLFALMGADGTYVEDAEALLPLLGFIILSARWLSLQALPMRETASAFLPVAPERRPAARLHILTLGVLFAMGGAVEVIAGGIVGDADPNVRSVPHFLLLLAAGLNMLRLGQLFLSEGNAARDEEGEGFWAQVLRLLGRALTVVAVAAPLVAAVGYINLGMAIMWPAAMTLALIALIGILQGFVFDLYAAATRRADAGRDALTPTLVGFALAIAAMPVLALIWGVRPSTLGEWWATFLLGFNLGGTRISPSNFLTFALVFVLGYMAVRLVKGVLRTNVLPKTKLDTGGTNAILSGTSYVGITLAVLIAITSAGIDLSGLAIVAGALSLGVGFGLQTIVQNFVSGIILLVERPIKIGDWVLVEASGVEGFVREISVRSTRIETFDRQDVIVPNADLISGVVTNYTLNNSSGRVVVTVGVAYGSDTRRVETILQEVAEDHPMVILNPPPLVTFDGFGADSLNFTVRVVVRDILFKVIVASELNHGIAERFAREGLEIPFAQRDIWLRNPETLRGAGSPAAPETSALPDATDREQTSGAGKPPFPMESLETGDGPDGDNT